MRTLTDRGKSVLELQISQERLRGKLLGSKQLGTSMGRHEPRRVRFQNLSCRMYGA